MRTRLSLVALALSMPTLAAAQVTVDLQMTERLKEEGLERSQALALFHTLTDELGARLTGSPEYTRAAEWARDRFEEWGLTDPRLEPFEFGRGWTLEKLSVEMVGDKTASQIRAMGSSLRGAIVLSHQPQGEFRDNDRPQPAMVLAAHLDSWHTSNGATDNGDGSLAVMEAARILAAVGARPRRTIRVALSRRTTSGPGTRTRTSPSACWRRR